MSLAGGLLGFAAYTFVSNSAAQSAALYVPFTSGTIIFGSTLVFYLRWLNYRFRQHAETEFHNLNFSKDILRASWIAELLLEAHSPTDERQQPFDIPDFLLEQYSADLFQKSTSSTSIHPIEDLQKYARQFKKLTVGPVTIESKDKSNPH